MSSVVGRLRERGVRLWLDGGEVRCRGPKRVLTPEVKAWLKEHKAAIAEELRPIESEAEVFEMARYRFKNREGLPQPYELGPPVRGQDMLIHRDTDKVRFFAPKIGRLRERT